MSNIPESDWKYLRTIRDELLEALCKHINDEASLIIADQSLSQHERFLRLFSHIMNKNEIIANCFDDWRRSNTIIKLHWLRDQKLLTDKHISQLTKETQSKLGMIQA
jgi:hypothetical protein